jgi:hypothetical protein
MKLTTAILTGVTLGSLICNFQQMKEFSDLAHKQKEVLTQLSDSDYLAMTCYGNRAAKHPEYYDDWPYLEVPNDQEVTIENTSLRK